MGAKWVVAAIEGNVLSKLDTVLETFGRCPMGQARTVFSWDEASSFVYSCESQEQEMPLTACVVRGWTVLIDPSQHAGSLCSAIFEDQIRSQELARKLGTRVFASVTSSVTCTYAYRLYDGEALRAVWVENGKVEDIGPGIPGEPPVDEETYNEECLTEVMELLGFDIELGVEESGRYLLMRVASSAPALFPNDRMTQRGTPWWKFW